MNCPSCGNPDIHENQIFCKACKAYLEKPKFARSGPFNLRLFAFIIDMFSFWGTPALILLLLNLYITKTASLTAVFQRANWLEWGSTANAAVTFGGIAFTLWFCYAIYYILQISKGVSPGKNYFNLRTVTIDGHRPHFWNAFVLREIVGKLLSILGLFIGFFWMLWDENARTWHDHFSHTMVLQLSDDAIEREQRRKKKSTGGFMIQLRENAAAVLFFLVFIFVLGLGFTGSLGGADIIDDVVAWFTGGPARGVIAKINDHNITYQNWRDYYNNQQEQYKERSGAYPEDGYQSEQFEDQSWNQMVDQLLINDYITANELEPTDEEVIFELTNNPPAFVRNEPAFQTDGIFDKAKYDQAWQNTDDPQVNQFWTYMEHQVRNEVLPRQKLSEKILSTVRLSEEKLKAEYLKKYQSVTARYVAFTPTSFTVVDSLIPEKELLAYYEAHPEDFKDTAKRKLAYVTFSTVPTEEDSQLVQERAADLMEEVKSGSDFAELAKNYSEDKGSAAKGGDVGYFAEGQMVTPFSDAVFNGKAGDIVGPIETRFGLHIIKVGDKKTEDGQPKAQASHILIKYAPSDETVRLAQKQAQYFAENITQMPWDHVMERDGLSSDTTNFFADGGYIPGIGRHKNAAKLAFLKMVGFTSRSYKYQNGYFVFKVIDAQEESTKKFDDVRNVALSRVRREEQQDLARNAAESFIQGLNGQTLENAANVQSPKPFTRTESVEGSIGQDNKFIGTAFGLEPGQVSGVIEGARASYIIETIAKMAFDEKDFDAKVSQLNAEVLRERQQQAYNEWFTKLRENANIKDYRNSYL